MILKNNNGIERNFKILFELENDNKKYIIYEDFNTLNIYCGRKEENILKPLDDKEFDLINKLIEKMYS